MIDRSARCVFTVDPYFSKPKPTVHHRPTDIVVVVRELDQRPGHDVAFCTQHGVVLLQFRQPFGHDLLGPIVGSGHVQRLIGRYETLLDEYGVRFRGEEFFDEKPARRGASAGNLFRMESAWLTRHASGSVDGDTALVNSGRAAWKKAFPYLRAHGLKATVRRSAEKILEKVVLLQGRNAR